MPTNTNETRETRSKESQSLDGPKCEYNQFCNAAVVPLTTQYFPQILHTNRIYKALVYSCCALCPGVVDWHNYGIVLGALEFGSGIDVYNYLHSVTFLVGMGPL